MEHHKQTRAVNSSATPFTAVVIRGLPGIGKTTLANCVVETLNKRGYRAFQVNADEVRSTLNKGLGFSNPDRIENARRIGSLTHLALSNRVIPVVDFVMPTKQTYDSFVDGIGGHPFYLWSLRAHPEFLSRFEDTKKIFERAQPWWLGGLFDERLLTELQPYAEDETQRVADHILSMQGYT